MATEGDRGGRVQTRWVEVVVALLIMVGGAVVIMDSLRVGIAWADDGPRAGYFPFFIGCILVLTAGWIGGRTLVAWRKLEDKTFVTHRELRPVFSMLLPTIGYVVLIYLIGLYVASAIYIAGFMLWQGKFGPVPALSAAIGVPVALFLLFEVWFLVPLPKGPVEHLLGY
jgi:hypothetical protein